MTEKQTIRPNLEEISKRRAQVNAKLLEKLTPWLFEFGQWIFGGLIAFGVVIIASLLTVGPDHPAVLLSLAIITWTLPLDVVGLLLVRLIKDMNTMAFDDVVKQAFIDAKIPDADSQMPDSDEETVSSKRRTDVGLRYSVRLAALCGALTLIGLVAALWYMAWWVAVGFILMAVISLVIAITMVPQLMRPPSETKRN